jgi:hypothetical protein
MTMEIGVCPRILWRISMTEELGVARTCSEPSKTTGLVGVRGWLLLFCLILIVWQPCRYAYEVFIYYERGRLVSSDFKFLFILESIQAFLLVPYGIWVGVLLYKIRPKAIKSAKVYLYAFAGTKLFFDGFLCLSGAPRTIIDMGILDGIQSIIFVLIWYMYIAHSKRVKNTYLDS